MKATEATATGTDLSVRSVVPRADETALALFRRKTVRLLRDAREEAAATRRMIDSLDSIRADQLAMLYREMGSGIGELVRLFSETTGEALAGMVAAVEAGDLARVSTLAHRVRGSASNFGAVRMMAICERLEKAALQGDGGEPALLLELLAREYQLVSRTLRR